MFYTNSVLFFPFIWYFFLELYNNKENISWFFTEAHVSRSPSPCIYFSVSHKCDLWIHRQAESSCKLDKIKHGIIQNISSTLNETQKILSFKNNGKELENLWSYRKFGFTKKFEKQRFLPYFLKKITHKTEDWPNKDIQKEQTLPKLY